MLAIKLNFRLMAMEFMLIVLSSMIWKELELELKHRFRDG